MSRNMKKKIVFLPYDFDTALGINNEGALVFSYNLEDIDTIAGGADVFNGQQSVLWKNLRETFPDELRVMYQTLRSTGAISYAAVEQAFENHQAKWPEAIFNEDAWFKYLAPLEEKGSAAYLSMLQGTKAEQRKWWLYNRFKYIDSKYNAGDSLSDVVTLRGYAKSNISLTPYADIYCTVKFGSYLVQERGTRNQSYEMVCPLDNVNDTEIYIYSASQLSDIGDLSGLKVGYAEFAYATKINSLKLGDKDANYTNGNLTELYLGNNTLLKTLDVRNCTALGTGDQKTVDLSGCTGIESVYFDGTAITGLTLPNGGLLRTLHLPSTITSLVIRNQTVLTDLTCPSYENVTTLRLENIGTAVDTMPIINAIQTGSRVRLIGFHWEVDDLSTLESMFDRLDSMRGLDQNGNNTNTAQLYGSIHAVNAPATLIASIEERYPDITITADRLGYRVYYMSSDGSDLLATETVLSGENGTILLPDEKAADAQYTYTPTGWSKTPNGNTDADALTNITADRIVYATYYHELNSYTITFVLAAEDGGTTLQTRTMDYGVMAAYTGSTPASSRGSTYSHTGWKPELAIVTGDATYVAEFHEPVTLSYYDYDGTTLLYEESVTYGGNGAYSTNPTKTPSKQYVYSFAGWSPTAGGSVDSSCRNGLTADKSVYAVYTQSVRSYTISFIRSSTDGGGSLQTSTLAYGTMPSYTGETPTTTRTDSTFVFNGWTPAITVVTEDATYTAVFKDTSSPLLAYLKGTITSWSSNTATAVGKYAFNQRTKLAEVETSAAAIGESAFQQCSSLETVDLTATSGTVTIAANAFSGCNKLTELFIRSNSVATLGNTSTLPSTFSIAGNGVIYVPASLVSDYQTATNWSTFKNNIRSIEDYPVTSLDTISDSWSEIATKINNGTATYSIGDYKSIDLGTEGTIKVFIVGENADTLADDSGTAKYSWWACVHPKTTHRMNPTYVSGTEGTGTIGGMTHNEGQDYLDNTIFALLPSELQSLIKEVKKYTCIYDTADARITDDVTTHKLYFLSYREVYGGTDHETLGPVYGDFFTSDANRIGYNADNKNVSYWWLRSADLASCFVRVGSGGVAYRGVTNSNSGVGFGFST